MKFTVSRTGWVPKSETQRDSLEYGITEGGISLSKTKIEKVVDRICSLKTKADYKESIYGDDPAVKRRISVTVEVEDL